MTLAPGTRLGRYEVSAGIGAGGMGEVYRARDTTLGRDVAIKTLPADVAGDPRRLARLESEARLLAALNHPHIATLHGLEESKDGTRFLVMELVEGETLADRIGQRPLSLGDVYSWGAQIAGALAAAHRRGIVHRDLKPANVMVTPAGVKLLDFGLAKAAAGLVGSGQDETRTHAEDLTAAGKIVGTLHYMSPEQLEGREADARSDVFALGAVLYEMATGRRAFAGESGASAIAAILSSEPRPLLELQPAAPPELERAIRRCLAKDPEARWQSARDLMLELEWIAGSGSPAEERRGRRGSRLAWGSALVGLAAALAMAAVHWSSGPPDTHATRFSLELPDHHTTPFARVSPDGRYLSATAYSGGQSRIWLRALDSLEGRSLPGTEGLRFHFWSPDSKSIAFLADGMLKTVDVAGGAPRTLCEAPGSGPFRLGAWGPDGTILFRVDEAPGREGLYRVPAEGGTPTRIEVVDESERRLLAVFPSFLPDGRRFLTGCGRPEGAEAGWLGVCVVEIDSGRATLVLPDAGYAEFVPPGHVLYARGDVLLAQPFDAGTLRLHGEAVRVADGLDHWGEVGKPSFSASRNGVLVFHNAAGRRSRLIWMNRHGAVTGQVGSPGEHVAVRLSPDGEKLALTTVDPESRSGDIWIVELARDVSTRLTSSGDNGFAVWSPDGRRLVYCKAVDAPPFLHQKGLDGGEAEVLLASSGTVQCPGDWSRDGRFLLFVDRSADSDWDVWSLPLVGDREPVPLLDSDYSETHPSLSPDGRWLAFASDETGEPEVYVRSFEGPGERRRVSTDGGWLPRWRRDGEELFYLSRDYRLMAVPVRSGAGLELGRPTELFAIEPGASADIEYDVSPDGQRFLINAALPGPAAAPTVVVGWDD